jgi:hypothetical protein
MEGGYTGRPQPRNPGAHMVALMVDGLRYPGR